MARENGPVATVQNKAGNVSRTQSIPANVGTPGKARLNAPKSERASSGYRISDGGIGVTLDARHTRGREGLFGGSQAKAGYTPRGIPGHGNSRATGLNKEIAIGERPK